MSYVIVAVRDGIALPDGARRDVATGYGAADQLEARADVLRANPDATGTARCWAGDYHLVLGCVSAAGSGPLEVEVPRGEDGAS